MLKIKDKLAMLVSGLAGVFRDFPFTMASILVAALFASIVLHLDHDDKGREVCERIMVFAFWMALQSFVIEEILRKKLAARIAGFAVALLFSTVFVYIQFYKGKTLFGADFERIEDIWLKIWVVYAVVICSLLILHIYKRIGDDFGSWCTRSFLALVRSYVLYGLFAAGLAVILLIFNELIYDTDDLLMCSEEFLAISFISAITIRALCTKHEKPGRFATICIYYAMLPMLMISYVIIYIYMIKIFVTDAVPSNSVFGILTGLFAVGAPIWTMAQNTDNKNVFLKTAARFVPFSFIPFIILQGYSLGIRIAQYGLTVSRYSGIVLIIFEVIYFTLYITGFIKKRDLIHMLLYAFIILSLLCAFCPLICFDDAVIHSQQRRIRKILSLEDISPAEGKKLVSSYYELKNLNYKGKKAAENGFSEQEISIIKETEKSSDDYYPRTAYLRAENDLSELDITDYKRILETGNINWEYGDIKDRPYELHFGILSDNEEYVINLEGLAASAMQQYEDGEEYSFDPGEYRLIKIDEISDLFIKEITVTCSGDGPEKLQIRFSGFVLKRK